jgi:hypothetical protein
MLNSMRIKNQLVLLFWLFENHILMLIETLNITIPSNSSSKYHICLAETDNLRCYGTSEHATGKDPAIIQQIAELHQLAESDVLRCYNE